MAAWPLRGDGQTCTVAQRRLARGLKLNQPEAVAIIASQVPNADGIEMIFSLQLFFC